MKTYYIAFALLLMNTAYAVSEPEPLRTEETDVLTKLADVASMDAVLGKVTAILTHDETRINACKAIDELRPSSLSVYEMPTFDKEGFLVKGTWQVRYEMKACERALVRTVLFDVSNAEEMVITALLPGTTQADYLLQADVRRMFFTAFSHMFPKCEEGIITNTQLTQASESGEGAWKEIWSANMCGNRVAQTVDFTPNKDGVAFGLTMIKGEADKAQ